MTYLDPMRLTLSGDKARAQQHVRAARAVAFGLVKITSEGGVESGRRTVVTPDGVQIDVVKAGMQVSAHINAPPSGPGQITTMAYVTANAVAPKRIYVVDVDAEKIVKSITGLGSVVSLCAHPRGRYLFCAVSPNQIVRIDLQANTAIGLGLDLGTATLIDMFMSPDGERLHARFTATGIPGAGGTYGGVVTLDNELAIVAQNPLMLYSNRTYRGAVHPKQTDLMYLVVFGDGDLDGDPITGHTTAEDYAPEAVEVYNYAAGAALLGDTLYDYHLSSGSGFRELCFDPSGDRAYVVSSRNTSFPPAGSPVPTPTVIVYSTTDGALERIDDLLVGVQLNGSVVVNRNGTRVYLPELSSGLARVLHLTDEGYEELDPLPYRAADVTGPEAFNNRAAQLGPPKDDRLYFLSVNGVTLWAFKDGANVPDKQIAFPTPISGTFALGQARRIVAQEQTA